MATGSKHTVVEHRPVEVDVYRLDLSLEEAETLRVVLCYVGGSGKSPRKHMSAVHVALGEMLGCSRPGEESCGLVDRHQNGVIYFRDYPMKPAAGYNAAGYNAGDFKTVSSTT